MLGQYHISLLTGFIYLPSYRYYTGLYEGQQQQKVVQLEAKDKR
jgi:hypothetical protein